MEEYAARFGDLFVSLAQRRGFREYLTGLLAPRDRNKTITCLAGAEPVTGAGLPTVQRLQFFLSETAWDAGKVSDRRLELLREQPETTPHDSGVIDIDDSGDRKDGTVTAHVGRQWLGRWGKTDNCVVTVTTVWTAGGCTTRCTHSRTPPPTTSRADAVTPPSALMGIRDFGSDRSLVNPQVSGGNEEPFHHGLVLCGGQDDRGCAVPRDRCAVGSARVHCGRVGGVGRGMRSGASLSGVPGKSASCALLV
ncbi:transposase [Streptomyces sp. CB02959]|uniref:transposase n=1 Tax=Streptomyces sp. CB02959 TaxID=2020330 RepID=UPI002152BE04|nr:transposase [Streptomyces sp. CB02959]